MLDVLGLAGIGVSAVSILFGILALALPLWESAEIFGVEFTVGLWESCRDGVCTKYLDAGIEPQDEYVAIIVMLFIAIFLLSGAIICIILKMIVKKDKIKDIMSFTAGALAFVAGLCMMIGFAVYAGEIANTDTYDYDASFALDIVGWILAWVAGGVFTASKFMAK